MKPITIAGAGLAGLALANALQRAGVPTTLHEAHTLPRHRVCGEFICGRGAEALGQLGLSDALEGARLHRTIQWSRLGQPVLDSTLPAPARGLSRYLLDFRLAESFRAAGGQLLENSRVAPHPQAGHIFCHGRQASASDWIGLKCHALDLCTHADLELHLGTQGYLGLSAIEDGRVNICALFKSRPELKARKTELLFSYLHACGLHALAGRIQASQIDPESHVGVAGIQFSASPAKPDAGLRLGDAYSVIPPFTGNGMSIALESAAIACPWILKYTNETLAWEKTVHRIQVQLHKRFWRRLRNAKWIHPWLHDPQRQRVLARIARLHLLPFQTLYKLTH
jgi:menaquinone-9 beta-reductase